MTLKLRTCVGLLLSAAFCVPANATTYAEEKFTCPIGGEKFKAAVVMSYTSFGQRPDGRAYGTLPIHPIVECPKNGFLLIAEEFSGAEIDKLSKVVASPEFQAMRTTETQHFRAWHLLKSIEADPYVLVGQLMQASWETDSDPTRKARYQAAFVAAATALKRDDDHGDSWFWYNLRAANALRELGHFDLSLGLLERLDKIDLFPDDPDQAQGARKLIDGLRALAQEGNFVADPANLIPDRYAAIRCALPNPPLSAAELPVCNSDENKQITAGFETEDSEGNELKGAEAIRYLYGEAIAE